MIKLSDKSQCGFLLGLLLAGCATAPRPAPASTTAGAWTLTPLHTGLCGLGKDHVLGDAYRAEDRLPFVIYSYLAEGPRGEVVLIDLGPKTLEYTNAMFRRHGFFRESSGGKARPDDIVQPHGNVFAHLARRGVPREGVQRIVYTHFHADHHGMDDASNGGASEDFTNARFSVSRRGWDWNVARRKDGQWNSYLDWKFGDFLMEADRKGRVDFLDDGEIAPGLEVRYLGGHSVCSRAVLVRTPSGWAVITSDDVYRYDLLEQGVMGRLYVTPEALVASTDRLVEIVKKEKPGAVLVPLHDPTVWDAVRSAGGDWLEKLRPLSERAVEGYLSKRSSLKILIREKGAHN